MNYNDINEIENILKYTFHIDFSKPNSFKSIFNKKKKDPQKKEEKKEEVVVCPVIDDLFFQTLFLANDFFIPNNFFGPTDTTSTNQFIYHSDTNFDYIIRRIILNNVYLDTFCNISRLYYNINNERIDPASSFFIISPDIGPFEYTKAFKATFSNKNERAKAINEKFNAFISPKKDTTNAVNEKLKADISPKNDTTNAVNEKLKADISPKNDTTNAVNEKFKDNKESEELPASDSSEMHSIYRHFIESPRKNALTIANSKYMENHKESLPNIEWFSKDKPANTKSYTLPIFDCDMISDIQKQKNVIKLLHNLFDDNSKKNKLTKKNLLTALAKTENKYMSAISNLSCNDEDIEKKMDAFTGLYKHEKYFHTNTIRLLSKILQKNQLPSTRIDSLINTLSDFGIIYGIDYILDFPFRFYNSTNIEFNNIHTTYFPTDPSFVHEIWTDNFFYYMRHLSNFTVPMVSGIFLTLLHKHIQETLSHELSDNDLTEKNKEMLIIEKMFHLLDDSFEHVAPFLLCDWIKISQNISYIKFSHTRCDTSFDYLKLSASFNAANNQIREILNSDGNTSSLNDNASIADPSNPYITNCLRYFFNPDNFNEIYNNSFYKNLDKYICHPKFEKYYQSIQENYKYVIINSRI